jgi:hypothetical protein
VSGQLLVPFEGDGAGVAELSWGQRTMWIPIRKHHNSIPMGMVFPLAAGVTVDDIAAQLRFLMGRHRGLRTRLEFDPAADREARQVLSSSGELAVELVDSELAGQDPAQAAEAVNQRLQENEFDYRNEWPVRCAVITHRGAPTHLVLVFCHLAIDGFGIRALLLDLVRRGEDRIGLTAELADSDGAVPDPGRGGGEMHSLDQARWQASSAGHRVNQRALQYWEQVLGSVSARRFPGCSDSREPRYRLGVTQSRAAYLAARAIAGRVAMRTAPVLFAAYAVAVARATGGDPVVAQVILSNRLRPGLTDSVSSISQPGLAVIDVADTTFDQVVRRAWRAKIMASRHSYYDAYEQETFLAAMSEKRGEPMEVQCLFNDRRRPTGPETLEPLTPDQLAEALPLTTVDWYVPQHLSREPFMTSVEHSDAETVVWSVFFDTHFLSQDRVETFLRELEAVLVDAAFDPACAALRAETVRGPLRVG